MVLTLIWLSRDDVRPGWACRRRAAGTKAPQGTLHLTWGLVILVSPLFDRLWIILQAPGSARPEPPTIFCPCDVLGRGADGLLRGGPNVSVYNPCAFTLDAATVPAGSPEREEMHIMHAFVTLRHRGISGAQQQAVPGFAAAHANTVCLHLTYFGILSMPGSSALDYCVDVRASVWVRIEGQHHYLNMELMQRHADGASILADVGGWYPQYADKCLALLCMD